MSDTLKVLLVDDEADFVETLAERLELRGIEARVALDGPTALDLLTDETPDAMVLDLKMPGMSGLEVLRRSLALLPGLPVLMLTGHGSPAEADEAMAVGAARFLQKPVEFDFLVEQLRETTRQDA